ncbi:choline transport protein [Aspergillus flavus]|nr:choline transport protein [Aspergillus flavus]RAQ55646.1 choline transport protein [Aspergillus flavus]
MDAGDKTDQEIEMGGYLSDHYTTADGFYELRKNFSLLSAIGMGFSLANS